MQHIFLVGAKCIGAYGGYETFVDKITECHQNNNKIKYHVATKANGQGAYKIEGVQIKDGEFEYHNAACFQIRVPDSIGSAQAIYYDCKALDKCIEIIKRDNISNPIIYIMACRIGPFFNHYKKKIHQLGGRVYINPDGHEWLRAKWAFPVKMYWKHSEKKMVLLADRVICDSKNIERYIKSEYGVNDTDYIAYGAETEKSKCSEKKLDEWLASKGLERDSYYLSVGRFVPENNYEIIIKEFMSSSTKKDLAMITNTNPAFLNHLEQKLHYSKDPRIKFVGTVYDRQLVTKIREEAYGNIHGHEVGGTNPSLLEALASTKLNLLLNVGFNEEVAEDAALYWSKDEGSLSGLINKCENIDRDLYGDMAKNRIKEAYTWDFIAKEYEELWAE